MWTESPNSPDEAWLKNSRSGGSRLPSKDDIQGQNGFKFQNSRDLRKTSKLNILKKVKTRDYKKDHELRLCQISNNSGSLLKCINRLWFDT